RGAPDLVVVIVAVGQDGDGALDGPTGAGDAALGGGGIRHGAVLAVLPRRRGRLAQAVEGQVGQLLGQLLQAGADLVEVGHQRRPPPRASSITSTGWRTSSPAAARCMAQPGLALTTSSAPVAAMAASLRSRIRAAMSGCHAA